MCGISGIFSSLGDVEKATDSVRRSVACLAHRGPDDGGVEVVSGPRTAAGAGRGSGHPDAPVVVFGHRRLSILDLSPAGHQPMHDPVAGNWITYNGEIYNFRELRDELAGLGHAFSSRCDTEVILKAYAEWGVGTWRRLRGIFAFGLWDARHGELHLVRDHLGVKPLYYAQRSRQLSFASEVRALLAMGGIERRLSDEGLQSYLKYGSVQEPVTLVEGVRSLPPGHYLTCRDGMTATLRRFWSPSECLVRNWERKPAAADVLGHLQDSVGRQLVADVPVGVFLSGGLDSTAIAALAARAQPGGVRTFCIGTDEPEFDESAEAQETARALGCQHTTLMLDGRRVSARLTDAIHSYDQPSYDGINTYFISLLVREAGMKVALSGLGGDELFVGYSGFRKGIHFEQTGAWLDLLPDAIRHPAADFMAAIATPGHAAVGGSVALMMPAQPAPYFASRTVFCRPHRDRFVSSAYRQTPRESWLLREWELARFGRTLPLVDRISFYELQTYMVSTLLRDSDQMSMAHGLELRVPFVDSELVEHVLPIAAVEKTGGGTGKQLLIDALAGIVPRSVFERPKRGFTLPFKRWLRQDLHTAVAECFNAPTLRGPWERKAFRAVWTGFENGRVPWSRVLTLYVLETWLEQNAVFA